MAITTGGDVTLSAGTLDSNFCHTGWQATLQAFINATNVNFNNGALFFASASTPAAGSADESKIWCKLDSSDNVLGWYWHDGSNWKPVPIPVGATAADTALPESGVTAATYGSASKHAAITVDAYGRVTSASEVDPAAASTDGMAKAWIRFNGSTGSAVQAYNCSVNRSGAGSYTVTTSNVSFTASPVVVASHSGFSHGTGSSQTFTVSPAIKVSSSVGTGNHGQAVLTVERAHYDGTGTDGDENWDAHLDDSEVSVVFFGN